MLTDGKILLHLWRANEKYECERWNGNREAIKKGYLVAIISGGKSQGLIERFKYLKINDIYLACEDKKDALSDLIHIHELDSQSILYMGDDINDWEVMKEVGLSTCPQDAVQK